MCVALLQSKECSLHGSPDDFSHCHTLCDNPRSGYFNVYQAEVLAHHVMQKAVDPDAETDADDSDQDRQDAPQNGLEDRRSKAMSGKATRAKERISKRVRPCLVLLRL